MEGWTHQNTRTHNTRSTHIGPPSPTLGNSLHLIAYANDTTSTPTQMHIPPNLHLNPLFAYICTKC